MLNRLFYDYVSRDDANRRSLIEKMKSRQMSSNESSERYLFLGEESYFFYTPLKYTNWMMVTVVPCRSIDMLGIEQCLRVFAIVAVGLIILLLLVFYYVHD